MKNKEKYVDFLLKCAANNTVSFGVDKITGEPKICSSSSAMDEIKCTNCRFGASFCGEKTRNEWLEEECDPWLGFRDLKRGDLILIKRGLSWHPYIFVEFIDESLVYAAFISTDEFFTYLMKETNPNSVKRGVTL